MFGKKSFTCPYCYEQHSITDCTYKCSYNIPGTKKDCKNNFPKLAGGAIPNKYLKQCQKCDSAKLYRFCPVKGENERGEIPERACSNNFSVALIGAKASGKTNYIAVLVDEIKRKMARSFDCSLIVCNQRTQENYNAIYYKPLYENATVVQVTDKGDSEPLIYAIDFFDTKKNKYKIKNTLTLSLYDTAGENADDEETLLCNNQYIANAKGIIVLLDPLQVPAIRDQLQGKIDLPELNTDTADILNRVVNVIRARKKITGIIDIPVALAFTKSDVLTKYNVLPADSCLRMESEHVAKGAFVRSDFENTQVEMGAFLDNTVETPLTQFLKGFSKHALFGLSALGENPAGGKLAGKPSPNRVLDPLLWLLADKKYIDTI